MSHRVVHCGTGQTGRHGLRGIINHPDLELVGLYVNTPSKIGVDAGELCGTGATGIVGTADIEEILALEPDCMSYMAEGVARFDEALADVVRFLEAGINVVTCSLLHYANPASAPAAGAQRLREACEKGQASVFDTGTDPGVCTWQMAAMLLGAADEVAEVRIQELFDYNHYDNPWLLHDVMGFGQPMDYEAPLFHPDAGMQEYFTGYLYALADSLGVEIDEIRMTHDARPTERTIDTAIGTVEAGSVGAIRFDVTAYVGGHPLLVNEHVSRLADDVAPDWARCSVPGSHCYRVAISGSPPFSCEWLFDRNDPEGDVAAEANGAMHAVNSIPQVIAAAPGHVDWTKLGAFSSRNVRLAPRVVPDRPAPWPSEAVPPS